DVGGGLSSAEVGLRVAGEHQVSNALAAATAGLALGLPLGQVCAALSAAESRSKWRMQLEERSDGLLVVNDAYNANPDSMRAAIDSSIGLRRPGGRVVAVLGDMLELGPDSPRLHAQIGEYAASAGVDQLVAVGEQARHLADGFARHGGAADIAANRCEAAKLAQTRATPRDVVLVKASRGLALETVAEEIASEAR
ncbi:MAG: UDP-N-acetylmuramoyl-tripeptide--D-alanyl-D-alanine ligase, partial [Propionibacteriaceae bacterium]|nr:UDP-N-acetylmuramoyl-tripeptide--D-alanyl-D-alanine ligase [Propionibacteriaceae bacterium]